MLTNAGLYKEAELWGRGGGQEPSHNCKLVDLEVDSSKLQVSPVIDSLE